MKTTSKFFITSTLLFSLNAFSQGQSTISATTSELKGVYVGLEYANLTDLRIDSQFTYSNGLVVKDTNKSGTHLGIAGVSAGFRLVNINDQPITLSGGLRVLQSFNGSEDGGEKTTFYIPEATLGYLLTEQFEAFAGLSIPVIKGSESVNKYGSRGGLSAGFSVNVIPKFSLKAAYNAYFFKIDQQLGTAKMEADAAIAGLAVSAQLMF